MNDIRKEVRESMIKQIQDKLKKGEVTLPEVPNFINCDWATGESYSYRTKLEDGEIKVEEIKTEDMHPIEHCSPNLKETEEKEIVDLELLVQRRAKAVEEIEFIDKQLREYSRQLEEFNSKKGGNIEI